MPPDSNSAVFDLLINPESATTMKFVREKRGTGIIVLPSYWFPLKTEYDSGYPFSLTESPRTICDLAVCHFWRIPPDATRLPAWGGFKIQRRDIIKHETDAATQYLEGMFHANLLDQFALARIQPAHVPVDIMKVNVLIEVRLQVSYHGYLAQRETV